MLKRRYCGRALLEYWLVFRWLVIADGARMECLLLRLFLRCIVIRGPRGILDFN